MRFISVVLVLASALWIGCGKKTQTITAPDGSKATVTQHGDGTDVTITGPKGETVRVSGGQNGVSLPEGFPSDVPIYPGVKVTTTAKTKEMVTAVLATADSSQKVLDFYGEKLKANGWDIENTVNMADGGMVNAVKDKHTCTAYVNRSSDETTISLAVAEKE